MTVIACRVNKGSIEIAGDSQVTWGNFMKYPMKLTHDKDVKQDGKLFQMNGFTVGCAGTCSHIGLFQIFLKTHQPKNISRDAIIEMLIEFKNYALDKAKISFNDLNIHGIMVYKGKAIAFYDFLEAYPIKTFDAVGSGMNLAIGAMEIGASVSEAVKVAIKYDPFCSGKITKLILK